MRRLISSGTLLALCLLAPGALAAQVSLTVGPGGVTGLSTGNSIALTGSNTQLEVTCGGVDCAALRLRITSEGGTSPVAKGASTATGARYTLNASMLRGRSSGTMVISSGSAELGRVPVTGSAATPAGGTQPLTAPAVAAAGDTIPTVVIPGADVTLGELLTTNCRTELLRYDGAETYVESRNWAQFVVTPAGSVVYRPGDRVDENDRVRVVVVGDARLVPQLAVKRQSAFRTPGALNIVGQGSTLPFDFKAATGCDSTAFVLGDFAPGQGQVQISVINADGSQTPVGSFDFGVHTLYSGVFALGAFRTELRDPTFGVTRSGGDTVLTQTGDGTPRVLYALTYTPFVWGRRDIEKESPWYQHLNPMVGVVLSDIRNNAVLGVSADLVNSIYLQAGVHAGRVSRLDPRSGLRLGDEFTRPADEIPTVTEWDADWFMGASLDLRAAVELLRTALTGSGGSE